MIATGFVAAPSLMAGAIEVLVPLRIDDLGGSATVIAAGFVVAAAIEAALAPIAGRYSDRAGRRIPFVGGILVCAVAMIGLAIAQAIGVVFAALFVIAFGSGLSFTPAITLLSEAGEAARLHEGFAAGLSNIAWASGQVIGALVGGGLASAVGFAAPNLAVAAVLAATAVYAGRMLGAGYAAPMTSSGAASVASEWRNWAGDQACRPVERQAPRNRDELAAAVAAAAEAGRKVSVAGSGHSFTEAAMTDGTMIDIGALGGVIDADPSSGLVKVGAGDDPRRAQRGARPRSAWRWRTSATSTARRSPARSRPGPTAPGRGSATSRRRSSRSSWSPPTARCASSTTPSPTCCGRRGSGSARSARSAR